MALSKLSETFLSAVSDELDGTIEFLEQLKFSPGHTMSLFMNNFDDDKNPTGFRGIDVRGGKKGIDAAKNYIATLTAGALKYMEKRFEVSSDIIKVLSAEFYFHKPITVHLELYLSYCFIHFLLYIGQY